MPVEFIKIYTHFFLTKRDISIIWCICSPSLEGKYSEHGSWRRGAPCFGGLCRYICSCNTDGEPGDEWRGAERLESAGYVGISAAATRTESLVTSGGARTAQSRRVMSVYLPLNTDRRTHETADKRGEQLHHSREWNKH